MSSSNHEITTQIFIQYGTSVLFSLIIFMVFWLKAEWLSSKVLGSKVNQELKTMPQVESIQTAGFILIGMLILTQTIPYIVGLIATDIGNHSFVSKSFIVEYSRALVQIIISMFLIFGADCISKTITKLRNK